MYVYTYIICDSNMYIMYACLHNCTDEGCKSGRAMLRQMVPGHMCDIHVRDTCMRNEPQSIPSLAVPRQFSRPDRMDLASQLFSLVSAHVQQTYAEQTQPTWPRRLLHIHAHAPMHPYTLNTCTRTPTHMCSHTHAYTHTDTHTQAHMLPYIAVEHCYSKNETPACAIATYTQRSRRSVRMRQRS